MLRRAFISLKTVTKSYVFNRTCKKDIYLLKTLSTPWKRVDEKKEEYVNPPGGTPSNTPLAHLLKCTLFAPSPPTPLPAKKKNAKPLFFISPGCYSRPKRNWKQCLYKILGGKYGALWEKCKWRIAYTGRLRPRAVPFLGFRYIKG